MPGAEPGAGDDVTNEVHRTPAFMAPRPEGQQTLNLVIPEGDEFQEGEVPDVWEVNNASIWRTAQGFQETEMVDLGLKDEEDMSARQRTICSKVYTVEGAWRHSGAHRTRGANEEHGVRGAWSPR